jgi:hypothetical protein
MTMALTGVTPCAEGYDVWTYHCFKCDAVFNLVEPRTSLSAAVSERRIALRHPVVSAGTIEFGTGAVSCMVRNLSAAGAGLCLTRSVDTPKQLTLVTEGSRLPCCVIWRRENRIGIAFR